MDAATRGSSLVGLASFIEERYGKDKLEELTKTFSPELQAALQDVKHAAWYPRKHFVELNEAIVSLCKDEDEAREALEAAGRRICHIATNTFMRLLLKMLTPAQFAKKFPDFWQRDMRGGYCSADTKDLSERRLYAGVHDVSDVPHVGPVAAGYIGFAMDSITGQSCNVEVQGWSLDNPAPEEVLYVVTW